MDRCRTIRALVLSVLGLAAVALAGCSAAQGDEPELRIGVMANFTNEFAATSGRPTMHAAQLVARSVNQQGGLDIGGTRHQVRVVFKDFADRPDAAATAARSLINQDGVDVIIGPQFSRHAIPVSVLAENAQVPMVSPMSTSPLTTRGKRYIFRLAYLDEVQATAMARLAHGELRARTAAMLFDDSRSYSQGMADIFREEFEALGGQVVASVPYTSDEREDFTAALTRIAESRPDVVWLPNWIVSVAKQIEQARAVGIDGHLMGGDSWDIRALGPVPEADGAYFVDLWHDELATEETRAFVSRYRSTYDEVPSVTAAMTYDAFGVVFEALGEQGILSTESIRDGLARVRSYKGATGTIRFRGTGDPGRAGVISRIEDGRAVVHRTFEHTEPPNATEDSTN